MNAHQLVCRFNECWNTFAIRLRLDNNVGSKKANIYGYDDLNIH